MESWHQRSASDLQAPSWRPRLRARRASKSGSDECCTHTHTRFPVLSKVLRFLRRKFPRLPPWYPYPTMGSAMILKPGILTGGGFSISGNAVASAKKFIFGSSSLPGCVRLECTRHNCLFDPRRRARCANYQAAQSGARRIGGSGWLGTTSALRHGAKRNCRNWTLWFPTARRLNLSLWQAAVKIMLRALVALAKGVVDSQRNWGLSCVYL